MALTDLYVRSDAAGGGDGTTNTNSGANGAYTLAEAAAIATGGHRFNVRVGTYTLGASITLGAGATENPNEWRGFNSTAGDLESVGRSSATGALDTANFPVIDGASSYGVTMGAYNILKNIKITTGGTLNALTSGTAFVVWRCALVNTHATSSASYAFQNGTNYGTITDCDLTYASNSASCFCADLGRGSIFGCRVSNSGTPSTSSPAINSAGIGGAVVGCVIKHAGIAIQTGDFTSLVAHNSWYDVATGIKVNGAAGPLIVNNVGWLHSGYAFIGTTSSGNPSFWNNAVGSHTSGRFDTGTLGSALVELNPITLTGDPYTNASGGDFTLNNTSGAGALCRGASLLWAGESDVGAVQHTDAGTGGGGYVIGG